MSKILFHGILICARQKKHSSKYVEVAACFVTLPACLHWFSESKDKLRNRKGTKKLKKRMLSIGNFLYFLLEKNGGKKYHCCPQFSASVPSPVIVHMCLRYAHAWPGEKRNNLTWDFYNSICTPFFSSLLFPVYLGIFPIIFLMSHWYYN